MVAPSLITFELLHGATDKLNLFLDTSSVAIRAIGRPAHGEMSRSATRLGEVIKVLATCWMALRLLF